MAKFRYQAIDKHGKELKGIEEASSIQVVLSILRERKLFPVKVLPVEKRGLFSFLSSMSAGKINRSMFIVSTRQLATLLNAGLPIVRALKVIQDQQPKGAWKNTLAGLIEAVESGSSFSDALARYPRVFSKLFINTVRAGESGGVLDLVLSRLADYLEKSQTLKKKIIAALIYPCVVLAFSLLVLTALMIFMVPKFISLFEDLDVQLPFLTQLLINISHNMGQLKFWLFIVVGIVLVKLLFNFIRTTEKGRFVLDSIKLKVPVAGKLTQKIMVSRFARTLGTLVGSGVPILEALNNTKETIENAVVFRGLTIVHDSVKEGESIVDPLRQCVVFDAIVVNMIAVGEETGKLDTMLLKIADTYDGEIDIIIAGMMSLLEPFLIIFLAIVIGGIILALFLPLVELLTSLSG